MTTGQTILWLILAVTGFVGSALSAHTVGDCADLRLTVRSRRHGFIVAGFTSATRSTGGGVMRCTTHCCRPSASARCRTHSCHQSESSFTANPVVSAATGARSAAQQNSP